MDFKNKTVLITAARKDTGQRIALSFAKKGAKVIITARNKKDLNDTILKLKNINADFLALKLDVTSYKNCETVIKKSLKKYGKIDYLINNASGYLTGCNLQDFSIKEIDNQINSTYRGVIYMSKAILNHFIENKTGVVVSMSSTAGIIEDYSNSALYSADKTAIIKFSKTMNEDFSSKGIKFRCIIPDSIREKKSKDSISFENVCNTIMMQCYELNNEKLQTITLKP